MKRWVAWILLAVVSYGLALIYTLPADRLYHWFGSHQPLKWYGIEGTVWSGHSQRADWQGLPLTDLDWNCSRWSMLTGVVSCQGSLQQHNRLSRSQWVFNGWNKTLTLENTQLKLAAEQLPLHWSGQPWLSMARLGGELSASLSHLRLPIGKIPHACTGGFQWQNAALVQPAPIALGNIQGQCTTTASEIVVQIDSDRSGQLDVAGTIRLTPAAQYQLHLRLTPHDTAGPLVPLLQAAGLLLENGTVEIRQQGKLN